MYELIFSFPFATYVLSHLSMVMSTGGARLKKSARLDNGC